MKMKLSLCALGLALFAMGVVAGTSFSEVQAVPAAGPHVYELRTYTTHDGKLDELHARFSNHTNSIFVRHGMKLIGYWTPEDEPDSENTLVYIIAHESRDAAKANWKAFGQDPDWRNAYRTSRENGPLVANVESVFLVPTDYSPLR